MDEPTNDGLKDTAHHHAQREDVRAGIPLLLTMLIAGLAAALAVRSVLSGGLVEWIAMLGVFAVTAHVTGIVYGWLDSTLRHRGDER